ncbi:MAG: NADH-quinone oxidoreductase subunit D [Planctomycetes bacterium]|nr:NADH-quinone oxidoreductase subunit D [Planctomycetota bacterium]
MPGIKTQEILVNMGPQHPSTHGVLRLVIKTDGELVTEVTPIVGYLHRCAEKIGENVTYDQWIPYTDRMDYIAAMGNNLGISLAVEKLLGMEAPPRAQVIRVLVCELNRVASHLIAFGTFGLDVGAFTPFLYAWREREMILNLFEMLCGARMTFNYIRIGGISFDIDQKFIDKTKEFIEWFEPRIKEYNDLLTYNRIFVERTAKIGIISPERAISYGLTGPNLRASGVNFDVRKDFPYCGYEKYQFNIPLGRDVPEIGAVTGDCWNRYYVRIEEMIESIKIIKQTLENIPAGEYYDAPKKIKPKAGEVYTRIENARGIVGFYIISDGSEKPVRAKVRAPSFINLSILPEIGKNVLVADLIAILGSIDIVLGEIDR